MIVTVYAICKNEADRAAKWYESMREADHVVVLDTGSTDGSVEILRSLGATVTAEKIEPWRFDVARNRSLELVSEDTDVCVCTDLDEVFERGWRAKLERAWTPSAKQARYNYIWSHVGERAGVNFYIEKAHVRKGFKWVNPVHEVLKCEDGECAKITLPITLHHYPDLSKSREQYLPLLELAVRENPNDDRNVHYLGREYMMRGDYPAAIATLKAHLSLPSATWTDERAASMRYVARCCLLSGEDGEPWYLRAIAEAPYLREAYLEYARVLLDKRQWHGVIFLVERALSITERSKSYINEPDAWGALPYDLLSLAYYHVGDAKRAVELIDKAIALSDDPRLKSNRRHFARST